MAKSPVLTSESRPSIISGVTLGRSGLVGQRELFPLTTMAEYPEQIVGADSWGWGLCRDTHRYILKGTKGGRFIPACEWIGTHLAEEVNLPCPTPKIVQTNAGELLFGSRIISGECDQAITSAILMSKTSGKGVMSVPGLAELLSEIFALDMFLSNIDRHDHNYLSVQENGARHFYLVDFGRSMLWNDDLSAFPRAQQPTMSMGRMLRSFHGFDLPAASFMIDKLAAVSVDQMIRFVDSMPEEWLTGPARETLVRWWRSGRLEKLQRLRKGLEDGSLLL